MAQANLEGVILQYAAAFYVSLRFEKGAELTPAQIEGIESWLSDPTRKIDEKWHAISAAYDDWRNWEKSWPELRSWDQM